MSIKITQEGFIKECIEKYDDTCDYCKAIYTGAKNKIIVICKIHKKEFTPIASQHKKNGHGCINCSLERKRKIFSRTFNEFIYKANTVHNFKYIYLKSIYKNGKTKLIITCPIEGHGDFPQKPEKHLKGRGCPKCGGRLKLTLEEFIKRASEVHNYKYIYVNFNYINTDTKSEIICPTHGSFQQSPYKHVKRQQGCPDCVSRSFGEKFIIEYLNKFDYKFENEFNIKLNNSSFFKKIDFFIKSFNLFIEFNGLQHYQIVRFAGQSNESAIENFKHQQIRDENLRLYCKINNINLLEIDIRGSGYNSGKNPQKLKQYVNLTLDNYIFRLKSKLYFTRNRVD